MGLFQFVDLTKDFYFSYTYDLTHSLQHNFIMSTEKKKSYPPYPPQEMFEWNYFQTEEMRSFSGKYSSERYIDICLRKIFNRSNIIYVEKFTCIFPHFFSNLFYRHLTISLSCFLIELASFSSMSLSFVYHTFYFFLLCRYYLSLSLSLSFPLSLSPVHLLSLFTCSLFSISPSFFYLSLSIHLFLSFVLLPLSFYLLIYLSLFKYCYLFNYLLTHLFIFLLFEPFHF